MGWKLSCDPVSGRLCSRSNALLVSCYPGLSNGKGAGHEGAAAVLFFSFFFSPLKDRYGRVRVLYSGAGNQVLRDGSQVVGMDVMA